MSLSIIIPVLNEADSIAAALKRLPDSAEVIVVDGGSTDNTVAIASVTADRVVASEAGRAKQMNAGAHVAQGDVLVFLHADTQLPVQFEHALSAFTQSTHAWGHFHVRLDDPRFMFRVIETMMNVRSRLTSVATGDMTLFVRRRVFKESGGYADIALMEDIEISKRLRCLSKAFVVRDRVVTSARRWQAGGILRTVLLMWRLRLLYFFGASPDHLARAYR